MNQNKEDCILYLKILLLKFKHHCICLNKQNNKIFMDKETESLIALTNYYLNVLNEKFIDLFNLSVFDLKKSLLKKETNNEKYKSIEKVFKNLKIEYKNCSFDSNGNLFCHIDEYVNFSKLKNKILFFILMNFEKRILNDLYLRLRKEYKKSLLLSFTNDKKFKKYKIEKSYKKESHLFIILNDIEREINDVYYNYENWEDISKLIYAEKELFQFFKSKINIPNNLTRIDYISSFQKQNFIILMKELKEVLKEIEIDIFKDELRK